MEEQILLNIEFNNDDVKAAVQNITDSRKAIDDLVAANKKLVEQGLKNSNAYTKNQESIKALNTEVSANSKIVQANTQAVKANENSIEALKEANKLLLIERNNVDTSTEAGRKKIKELNAEYDKNSKIISDNSTKVEKQRFNIGNYVSALDGVVPGLGAFSQGLGKATEGQEKLTGATNAFKATGIGLIIAAIAAAFASLQAYLKGSEEGQDKLNKITAVAAAIWEQFLNVVEGVGKAIFEAIENPKKALASFGEAIKENIINRFEGILEFIPAIGKSIKLLFEGEFAQAGQVAFDAVAKVTTGVEGATEKIAGLISNTVDLVNAGIAAGEKIAALQSKIDKEERALVTERTKTALEVSKLRQQAVEQEGEARKKTLKEAIALEEELSKREVAIAKTQEELAALKVKTNGDDKEALNELAAAQAKVFQAEEAAFANTLRFRKELQSLDEEEQKKLEELEKKKAEIAAKEETAANRLEVLRLEQQAKAIQGAELRADKLIEIEQIKAEQLLANDELTESERQIIVEDSEAKINAILDKSQQEQIKETQDALAAELEAYSLYVEGLINEKKRQLLEGTVSQAEYNEEIANLEIAALETQLAIKEQFGAEDVALAGRVSDAKIKQKETETAIYERQERAKVQAVQSTLGQVAGLFNKNSIAFKALASAQTLIQTYQSAQAVFTGMTSTIPGPVGIALGIAGAAAAVISGLANVAKINSTQVPKLEEGGLIEVGGRRHSQGGEDMRIGGKLVANVEQGETVAVLKRGSSGLLRNLSAVNTMVGGRDFYNDRSTRFHNADGGLIARSAISSSSQFATQSVEQVLKGIKIFTRVTDLERVQSQQATAKFTSELS